MNSLDVSLAAVVLVSVIIGALRGFVKEAAALAGWVLAVVLVPNSSALLARHLPFDAGTVAVRTMIAAILIVLACVVVAHLVGRLLRALMTAAQLGGPDRVLGALFGIARAVAIWLLVAAVVIHFDLSQRVFWKSSRLAPLLEAALRWIAPEFAPSTHRPMAAPGV
jgi:membrane protein required for colicin V production